MDVFISHSSADLRVAEAMVTALERGPIRCFCAPRDLAAGVPYGDAIMEGLRDCRVFVVIVSANSLVSAHVANEVERALHYGRHVIPFRIDRSELRGSLELFLSSKQWIDANDPPLDPHLERLRQALTKRLGDQAAAPTPASQPSIHAQPQPPLPAPTPPPIPPPILSRPWKLRWVMAALAMVLVILVAGIAVRKELPAPLEPPPQSVPERPRASLGEDVVRKYLTARLAAVNDARSHDDVIKSLQVNTFMNVSFDVEAGRTYTLFGACDDLCGDLDLEVFEGDRSVVKDTSGDKVPTVTVIARQKITLVYRMTLAKCEAASCFVGVGIVSRNTT